ncbi:hypothetical protein POREN0001_0372 [Porphyromonas endodontalis ATCC 35406]|uniref:Uncharacterized protein n=1 Tax=Porphyromonas endodontalis (strain ATCC 35406 / DSM 24491 / JCM 8526 / CCUG 16442 / BCRC 14492 / NCTC 13058 / HG 370) TaxID=553175 RepID=C3JAY0_POREA|nr:hypothetical protein POREN0001_0372 [Porphyromonas endodontalis ATCC 35406]
MPSESFFPSLQNKPPKRGIKLADTKIQKSKHSSRIKAKK